MYPLRMTHEGTLRKAVSWVLTVRSLALVVTVIVCDLLLAFVVVGESALAEG